jgi:uncharacterized protein YbcC (UPF0753/DUF2309 family)
MNIAEKLPVLTPEATAKSAILAACDRIPPLYSLENFVAVNPFLGWSKTPLIEASAHIALGLDAQILPDLKHYRTLWQNQKIDQDDIVRAATRHGINPDDVFKAMAGEPSEAMVLATQLESERVLNQLGIDLPKAIQRFVSRSLADVLSRPSSDTGGSVTPSELYKELVWRASVDRTLELLGVPGWRKWIRSAPDDYAAAIRWVSSKRPCDSQEAEAYAYRLLGSQYGWASYLRGLGRGSYPNDLAYVEALCAALEVFDLAISELVANHSRSLPAPVVKETDSFRLCLQDAYEDRLVKSQVATFNTNQPEPLRDRPDFQLMFCIDVRSEVIRRNLELLSSKVETVGFAGFFGVGVNFVCEEQSSARCPVLLDPPLVLKDKKSGIAKAVGTALRMSYSSPGSFNLVEAFGIGYIVPLLLRATGLLRKVRSDETPVASKGYSENHFGLTLAERVSLAESILINSGIGNRLGRVVVLCGHGGRSSNNAHEASLDCGACGGHCGALNAQMAVEVLSDSNVRQELARRGYIGVEDALYLAALHDTSTDQVSILQPERVAETEAHKVGELKALLAAGANACRRERAHTLRLTGGSEQNLLDKLDRKSNDWSEVRPEWGLARNASFIAAPRSRTRGANLEGRTFLHDYDAASDTDDSVLKLILSAPMVVASWINLQYFASTVNNERFGCGTKALLNRIGSVGVISGNDGDLRPGLPIESVHRPDGTWFHDPVRLQVIVEAPIQKIDRVLSQVPEVADLVNNGWLRLFALERRSGALRLRQAEGEWEEFSSEP